MRKFLSKSVQAMKNMASFFDASMHALPSDNRVASIGVSWEKSTHSIVADDFDLVCACKHMKLQFVNKQVNLLVPVSIPVPMNQYIAKRKQAGEK